MSAFGTFLENELERQKKSGGELAAAMGIDGSLLSGFINNRRRSCNVETLMKMVRGISPDENVQAALLEAYFRDQCLEKYKPWIKVDPESPYAATVIQETPRSSNGDGAAGDPIGQLAATLRALRLPNPVVRSFADIAQYLPGKHKFRVVLEDLGKFAREELQRAPGILPPLEAFLITDGRGRLIYCEPAFTEICGYRMEDLRGRPLSLLQGEATEPAVRDALRASVLAHRPFTGIITNYRRDGSPYRVHLETHPVSDPDGQFLHFEGRVRLERELK
jgi:PAS domain S-box-containing protein